MPLHAYYSYTQEIKNSVRYIYLTADGTEIICTEVMNIKKENLTENFLDNKYLGEVVKYSDKINLNELIIPKVN